jgi:hypothetical protein
VDQKSVAVKSAKPPMAHERSMKLHAAVAANDIKILRRLLAAGADVDIRDRFGAAPLHAAAGSANVEICGILLSAGADVNATDVRDQAPLHYAVGVGAAKVCAILLANGANVNIRGYDGRSPLHIAADRKNEGLCKILLDAGADQYLLESQGFIPIDFAVKMGSLPICRLFEEHSPGISVTELDAGFPTPFVYAVSTGRLELVRYFALECGADLDQVSRLGYSLEQLAEEEAEMQLLLRSLRLEVAVRDQVGGLGEGSGIDEACAARSTLAL